MKLTNLKTPISIHKFCIENTEFCMKNKNLICKNILRISGYKVPTRYKDRCCEIFKELLQLVPLANTKNKLTKIENELYLYFDPKLYSICKTMCSDLLLDFLSFNGIIIKRELKRSNAESDLYRIALGNSDKSTVKMSRS